ncbi:MAG TPA: glycoside hydrolase family 88 protein, partial [Asticcacaulis sp.]|nr:glycoside hydrolase family 88 protein [Asticcacaulis sp.]
MPTALSFPWHRRGFLVAAAALLAAPGWSGLALAAPEVAPPQTDTQKPVRDFKLGDAGRAKLAAFGTQVPAFTERYFASRTGIPTSWFYEDGCIWLGALDLYAVTQDKAFFDYVLAEMQTRVLLDGSVPGHHPADLTLDNINAAKVLFPMYALTGEARFRQAMELPIAQLREQPRTQSGNYWHKQVYTEQVWLDGVYMAQPLQTAYAKLADKPELFADTVRQLQVIEKVMKKPDNGLYYHGWDESRKEAWADPKT